MSKRQVGATAYNEIIRSGKDAVRLLRDDIDEIRAANQDNADVLNFLLKMSGRLDTIYDAFIDLQEIGGLQKSARRNGEPHE